MLEYRIPLHADDALDSLDDHLKIEGESRPYEVMSDTLINNNSRGNALTQNID